VRRAEVLVSHWALFPADYPISSFGRIPLIAMCGNQLRGLCHSIGIAWLKRSGQN
jgi:hypothetical protein